ncbi:MAG: lipid-A-disaccharide synthase [Gemmatimonadales bacterium]|jgi:lipid-A-disaccharide synthase|nr:MAG: lipid-A-disaccharide synthase [Gemmatimonadales bacterium]
MTERAPRILVSAGEPSGDLHGAEVVAALRDRWPAAQIDAVGGPRMAAAGAELLFPMERLSAMGAVEILRRIPAHLELYRRLRAGFREGRWDLYLPIDYPGFHLRTARAAMRAGSKVLYYIPPQLWAWGPGRVRKLAAAVDRLAVILPFEPAFFAGLGLSADYVGHPLLDRPPPPSRTDARSALGIAPEARVLALFPGSREQEVRSHWKTFLAVAERLRAEGRCDEVVVAVTPAGTYPDPGVVRLHADGGTVLAAADACLAKSGTTTLEAALADVPMAVAYRMNPLTFAVARRVVTVQWVSLANLVAERAVVPEFLQEAMTVPALAAALGNLLTEGHPARVAQLAALAEVRGRLGAPGASARVAAMAAELLAR